MFISLTRDGGFGTIGVAVPGDPAMTTTADARLRGELVMSVARQRIGAGVPNACRTGVEHLA